MRKLSIDEVRRIFNDKGYELLSEEYINNKSPLRFVCSYKHVGQMRLGDLKKGHGRKSCGDIKKVSDRKYKYLQVKQFFIDDGCQLVDKKYKDVMTPMRYVCKCGEQSSTTLNNFLKGQRCRRCGVAKSNRSRVKKFSDIKTFIDDIGYELLTPEEEYKDTKQKLKIRCDSGHFTEMTYNSLSRGRRCGSCRKSKSERIINDVLTKKEISFSTEYRFNECRNVLPLPFDFAIMKKNEVVGLIEYQGEQHFKVVGHFNDTDEKLSYRMKNDEIKRVFCGMKDIPLLVIPYWKINVLPETVTTFINNL